MSRSTYAYQLKRESDAEFKKSGKELAIENPRLGYRRIHALLKRDGLAVNRKRVEWIWEKFGL